VNYIFHKQALVRVMTTVMGLARCSLLLSACAVRADIYMHNPPGANNRLAEGGGNRNNNNRLMDSQNNNKGGYGYGGSDTDKAPPVKYIVGSKLSVAFTAQHSCGAENAECQLVLQYMCNDAQSTTPRGLPAAGASIGEGPVRDGTDGDAPDPNDPQAARGLHEPTSYYQACEARERNKGLYNADQNVNNGDGATATRQNPNGARSGLECPEERDYYPYWHPTPWRDLAVMTNNLPLCEYYATESHNVKAKNYCTETQANNADDCAAAGGTWTSVEPFNLPKPLCISSPFQRDNHLGNGPGDGSNEVAINISIPAAAGDDGGDVADNCVFRLRYNITTGDTRVCSDASLTTKAECEADGAIWSAAFLDSSYNKNERPESATQIPNQNQKVDMDGFLQGTGGTDSILELAINTNQYGRTFQDRSHVFSIRAWPEEVPANADIYNLNVKGKRGNIVQTYPATEYDFHPTSLVVGENDYVHFQWTGNDNTNNNGNNNGEGTNNEDRHNIVQIGDAGLNLPLSEGAVDMFDVKAEVNLETNPPFNGPRSREDLIKQFALVKQTDCAPANAVGDDQSANNCEKLNRADATIDLGLLRMKPGTFKYMSSRNNNFSNRGQKGKITVLEGIKHVPPKPPSNVQAEVVREGANAAVSLTWNAHDGEPYTATNGKVFPGRSEQLALAATYLAQYSADGGKSWTTANCAGSEAATPECSDGGLKCTCQIGELSAGTTYAFQVLTGGRGGWGQPSAMAIKATSQTSESQKFADQLKKSAKGEGLSAGAIAGIVFAVLGALGLLAFGIFLFRRRQPPPPPPGATSLKAPPPPGQDAL